MTPAQQLADIRVDDPCDNPSHMRIDLVTVWSRTPAVVTPAQVPTLATGATSGPNTMPLITRAASSRVWATTWA